MILGSMISVMGVDYIDARTWALNICMAIWSMRLSLYIACRHNGEDWRYVKLRERYEKCGKFDFDMRYCCILHLRLPNDIHASGK